MAKQKTRNPRYVTPEGIAIYPHLIEPDDYKGTLAYKTSLGLDPSAELYDMKGNSLGNFQEFLDQKNQEAFEHFTEQYKGKKDKKGKPIQVIEADAPYEFNDAGDLVVRFKLNHEGKTRDGEVFTQSPALFDAKGKPFEEDAIWGGSRIKVSFEVIPYYMASSRSAGISLRLKAAQIIELRKGGQANADAFGFGAVEGADDDEDDNYSNDFSNSTNYEDDEDGEFEGDF